MSTKKYSFKYKLRSGDNYENLSQRFGTVLLGNAGIYGDEDLKKDYEYTFNVNSREEAETALKKDLEYQTKRNQAIARRKNEKSFDTWWNQNGENFLVRHFKNEYTDPQSGEKIRQRLRELYAQGGGDINDIMEKYQLREDAFEQGLKDLSDAALVANKETIKLNAAKEQWARGNFRKIRNAQLDADRLKHVEQQLINEKKRFFKGLDSNYLKLSSEQILLENNLKDALNEFGKVKPIVSTPGKFNKYHTGRVDYLRANGNKGIIGRGLTLNGNNGLSYQSSMENLQDLQKLGLDLKDYAKTGAGTAIGLAAGTSVPVGSMLRGIGKFLTSTPVQLATGAYGAYDASKDMYNNGLSLDNTALLAFSLTPYLSTASRLGNGYQLLNNINNGLRIGGSGLLMTSGAKNFFHDDKHGEGALKMALGAYGLKPEWNLIKDAAKNYNNINRIQGVNLKINPRLANSFKYAYDPTSNPLNVSNYDEYLTGNYKLYLNSDWLLNYNENFRNFSETFVNSLPKYLSKGAASFGIQQGSDKILENFNVDENNRRIISSGLGFGLGFGNYQNGIIKGALRNGIKGVYDMYKYNYLNSQLDKHIGLNWYNPLLTGGIDGISRGITNNLALKTTGWLYRNTALPLNRYFTNPNLVKLTERYGDGLKTIANQFNVGPLISRGGNRTIFGLTKDVGKQIYNAKKSGTPVNFEFLQNAVQGSKGGTTSLLTTTAMSGLEGLRASIPFTQTNLILDGTGISDLGHRYLGYENYEALKTALQIGLQNSKLQLIHGDTGKLLHRASGGAKSMDTYLSNVKSRFGGTFNPFNPNFRFRINNYDGTLVTGLNKSRLTQGKLANSNSLGKGILDYVYKDGNPHYMNNHGHILVGFPGLPSLKGSRYNMMYDAFNKIYPEGLPQRRRTGQRLGFISPLLNIDGILKNILDDNVVFVGARGDDVFAKTNGYSPTTGKETYLYYNGDGHLIGKIPGTNEIIYWDASGTGSAGAVHAHEATKTKNNNPLEQPSKIKLVGKTLLNGAKLRSASALKTLLDINQGANQAIYVNRSKTFDGGKDATSNNTMGVTLGNTANVYSDRQVREQKEQIKQQLTKIDRKKIKRVINRDLKNELKEINELKKKILGASNKDLVREKIKELNDKLKQNPNDKALIKLLKLLQKLKDTQKEIEAYISDISFLRNLKNNGLLEELLGKNHKYDFLKRGGKLLPNIIGL